MSILVAGATGTTGAEVAAQLAEAGVPVRAMTRSPEKVEALRAVPGVEPVVAAFDDPSSLAAAFDGVSAAYVVTPAGPDMAETEGAFARAAAEVGAHVVKLSAVGASADAPLRFGRVHAESEAAIEALGGSWTFVQPNGFMQNDLAWAQQLPGGTVRGPVMDAAWSIVDVVDVAAVAVAALTRHAEHAGARLVVTGPEALTPRERLATLAELLGRAVEAVEVPIATMQEQLGGFGIDPWTAEGVGELWQLYADGGGAAVSPDIERVLGRRAGSWQGFATQHLAAFDAA